MSEDRLLKVAEVAERLRVNRDTVRRYVRSGRLKGVLLGGDRGGYRIRLSDLEAFLANPTQRPDEV
jgi:excisionase family DNA binding protein